jgi:hypothetical protein
MGTWGVGAFENDIAADWSWEFESADLAAGLQLITDALTVAAQADGASSYLDAGDGSVAIAAAAMVAAVNGQPIDESAFGEDARQWITRVHPSSDASLTGLARQAVSRGAAPPQSYQGCGPTSTWRCGSQPWLSYSASWTPDIDRSCH